MRVGFGATVLARGLAQGGVDGIGNYTRELMGRLGPPGGATLVPYAFAGGAPDSMAQQLMRVGSFQRQSLVSLATGLPFLSMQKALAGQVDLVHATDHYIPRLRGVPVVATLMDAIPLAHPEWVAYRFKALKNIFWRRSAQWAQHVLTISEHSRQEISHWFGIPEHRISVTPLGVDARWFTKPLPADVQRVRTLYALPERYFLAVGTLQPRKNIGRLIAAHKTLPARLRRDVPLVVVGKAGWGCEDVLALLRQGDAGALRWLHYVPDVNLLPLMSTAAALVFPSLHEGFGLPVLEAFAAGTPVIASNTTSVPEVAGKAAILIDPMCIEDMADAMKQVVQNDQTAQSLRIAGLARARNFTWENTAEKTMKAYEEAVKSN